ncbi:hypothetical protein PR048_029646 [Dryococelus australis]|uniref:Uncharacterized protein n=1 Tax=Dryococelus australis TaxID=614101 RepID=A0ABQ9GDY2_9NEOP|nr:hypothetical protein PR048_029646 [Dryococelus australis]
MHTECMRDYYDKRRIAHFIKWKSRSVADPELPRLLRSTDTSSEISEDANHKCLFCGELVSFAVKHNVGAIAEGVKVRTYEFQSSVTEMCRERNDEWGMIVLGRMNTIVADLHAADTVYHRSCSANFRTGRNVPVRYSKTDISDSTGSIKRRRTRRPSDDVRLEPLELATQFYEANDDEQE